LDGDVAARARDHEKVRAQLKNLKSAVFLHRLDTCGWLAWELFSGGLLAKRRLTANSDQAQSRTKYGKATNYGKANFRCIPAVHSHSRSSNAKLKTMVLQDFAHPQGDAGESE
jgi:hypothetical protein